ncbi:hypothetical protein K469DRAFT_710569 [Zopfia rhizophila CBS 207.26]|uniref:Rhodanese domain-containing protein n=1 Tax=Zopfia rhizophila CBS 207.26 TaxID=1314779 RepID=A0A6A6E0Q9_9PEZI|nr:hypothetical protein K469DRAFT_710569 [Zopfia rhizophila CBS 207.26]
MGEPLETKEPMKLVIVGGVAGGLSFAARARRLSEFASITVIEAGPFVGYANCGVPYALGGIISSTSSLVLQTPESFKARFNIDVLHNTEVLRVDRGTKTVVYSGEDGEERAMGYDKLILAQGAEPFHPPIPGSDAPNIFSLQTIPDLERIKKYMAAHNSNSVSIIGGGFIGLEAAESLHALGLKISIIEYASHVFPPVDHDIAEPIHTELRRNDISLHLNARIKEIVPPNENSGSHVVLEDGEEIEGDVVLLVVGVRPRAALAGAAGLEVGKSGVVTNEYMQTSDPDIYAVGDMAATKHRITGQAQNLALAGPANRQGRLVADHIFGGPVCYRGNVGTSICRIFSLTVGIVGLSISSLKNLGMEFEYATIHPPHHAGYYPGATPMTLKLAFSQTGKVLGAQVLGKEGVNKRIDILATAIQARMSVFDLEHLELGYAPPFSSAKDPVNMVGFVASNVLRGDVEVAHAEDLMDGMLKEYQIIDVRSPGEFAKGHVVGAMLIPLDKLRGELKGIDRERKVLVYCQVGYRGYLSYRILKQSGFEVWNLDGGYKGVVQGGYTELQASLA